MMPTRPFPEYSVWAMTYHGTPAEHASIAGENEVDDRHHTANDAAEDEELRDADTDE
jgi:hypothetical protein